MKQVGAYEARTQFSRLLEHVARGESITITKHGVPVAVLSPPPTDTGLSVHEAIEGLRQFRRGKTLGGIPVRELIAEGRRR